MSRVIADGLSKRVTATTQEAEDAVEGKYPDAAGVHAAFNQYGLGVTNVNSNLDLDALNVNGVYKYSSFATGAPNSKFGECIHSQGDSNFACQIAIPFSNPTTEMFFRTKDSGVWTAWRSLYNNENILGTVSQSAGVPTGAIIERGSNANGEWTKFADGTMWASTSINLGNRAAFGSGTLSDPYRTGAANWTFPAAFASAPDIFASGSIDNAGAGVRANSTSFASVTATSVIAVQIICTASPSTASDATIYVSAFGRWY